MKSVTRIINEAHLNNASTLGAPKEIDIYGEPLTPSINFSTAYAFKSIQDLGAYHEDKYDSVRYSRDSSVLVRQLEHYFELMHSGHKVLLFNSGMAAISACLNVAVDGGSVIISFGSFYRKSLSIFEQIKMKYGVAYEIYDSVEKCEPREFAGKNVVIYLESPSNPFLKLIDVEEVRALFPKATIILDITLQGLLNSKSQMRHADLVVSSCTKYIGGHNDILGGFVACMNDEFFTVLWEERSMRGGIIDNFGAYLLLRSLRTYDLRMQKTLENVESILEFLGKHHGIVEVYYPGRFSNRFDRELFEREHYHGGGVITFKAKANVDLVNNLRSLCSTKMAPSFGSVDTLVEIPMFMSHWGKSRAAVERLGLDAHTVRLSVGNEPAEFILDDISRLLDE